MIAPRAALKFASTKLRTRKVRLTLTIALSATLFGVLFFVAPVARGAFASIERFGKEGLGARFVVQASTSSQGEYLGNETVLARATALNADILSQKKAAAKRLGLPFDAKEEPSPITETESPTGRIRSLNMQHPAAKAAIKEYLASHSLPGIPELRTATEAAPPSAFYEGRQYQTGFNGEQLQIIKNGKENFEGAIITSRIDDFLVAWTAINDELISPFVLPEQDLRIGADGTIPLVIPFGAVESLLQAKLLPNNASATDRIAHVREVRAKAPSLRFSVCYRNKASVDLISEALGARTEAAQNKNNASYQRPALVYGLPDQACAVATVVRDVRTATEKALDDKKTQLANTPYAAQAEQKLLTFRIVGISPDQVDGNASNTEDIIHSIVNSSLGYGWYMPSSLTKQDALIDQLFTPDAYFMGLGRNYFVEFASAGAARSFMNEKGCSVPSAMRPQNDDCTRDGKIFSITPFGSNTLGLDSIKGQFNGIFTLAILVAAAVACVIMCNTIGRMIVDSRRETAVFRAIGAKRADIACIYLTYAFLLSTLIAVAALVLGTVGAYAFNAVFSSRVAAEAVVAYTARDLTTPFSLFTPQWTDALALVALILCTGFVAAALPLIRNVRRDPIRDMRDDV